MKNQLENNIDKLFLEKLGKNETNPPADMWSKIEAGLGSKPKKGFPWFMGIVGAASVALLFSLLLVLKTNKDFYNTQQSLAETTIENNTINNNDIKVVDEEKANINEILENETNNNSLDQEGISNLNNSTNTSNLNNISNIDITSIVDPPNTQISYTYDPILAYTLDDNYNTELLPRIEIVNNDDDIADNNIDNNDDDYQSLPGNKFEPSKTNTDDDYNKPSFTYGVHFSPEVFLTKTASTLPYQDSYKFVSYNLDFSLNYNINNLLLETGLGFNFASDVSNYVVEYNEHQIIDTYEDVLYVTYENVGGEIVPTYHTQNVNVYDTVLNSNVFQRINNYTYLNVPFSLGYKFNYNNTQFFVKGGAGILFKIYENRPELILDESEISIIDIENKTLDRIDVNTYASLALGVTEQLNTHFAIRAEIMSKYYFNSPYHNSTYKPYTLGMRLGVLWNF